MENKVNKADAKKFLKETGYEFDSYIMAVVEMMLFNFAEQQVKIHCDKSNVSGRSELLKLESKAYDRGYLDGSNAAANAYGSKL